MTMPQPGDVPQPPRPQQITPQPVPQSYSLQQVPTDDGKRLVALSFTSVNGQWVAFFDADSCEALAAKLIDNARQARTGIIVTREIPSPNGHGPSIIERP